MSLVDILILLALVAVSVFLSSSEIALFSLSRFQLRSLKDRYKSVHRAAKKLLHEPGDLLVTILLVNEIVNVSISARVMSMLSKHHSLLAEKLPFIPEWTLDTVLGLVITTPILLMICEITPKVIAARLNIIVTLMFARPMAALFTFLRPVRYLVGGLVRLLTGGSRKGTEKERNQQALLKESEFLMMIEEGHKEGAIQESELELIRNVFELDDMTVSRIATPLSRVQTLSRNTTLKGALAAYKLHQFSRIPVVGQNKKRIVGVLYSKDLLRARLDPSLHNDSVETLLRQPVFVSSQLRLNALFRRFKQQKIHMAIVQNDKQEPVGIVTMSDLLEVLIDDLIPDSAEEVVS